ncbi:MAG: DNA repair protein RecO [bacterium]|nr:DNA repair protein RecO [bacterium]MBU1428112.1 DNA repair protein RecO [bacterium]MBU2440425.1 DNA repair protein RecO [bacterium]
MLYKTEGIVLKSMEYEEADKIVTIYTKNYGKITAIAKGVRKTKSKFGSSLELLTHSVFLFYKGRNIDIVSQAEILESFFSASKEVIKFACAANCVEVVNKLTEEREINIGLFNLLKEVLHYLRETNDPKLLTLSFKWQTMSILGYRPSLNHCCRCNKGVEDQKEMYFNIKEGGLLCNNCIVKDKEGCVKVSIYFNKLVRKILITPLSTISNATIPDEKIKELEKITDLYIAYHSEKSFKTDGFLKYL